MSVQADMSVQGLFNIFLGGEQLMKILPEDAQNAVLVGRVWRPEAGGPCLVVCHDGQLFDITSKNIPTMRDLTEADDSCAIAREAAAMTDAFATVDEICRNSLSGDTDKGHAHFLAPCDLQAIKACGVTFASSMIERVIEEKASGDPARAEAIRKRCQSIIGTRLSDLKAGSEQAEQVKQALIAEDMWSQYLEVGIGPDAEVFTKSQPMSAIGWGARAGLHPMSGWNNPEPEIVLAVNSRGQIKGASLGNDVNLRDVEGRSALLLGKAKDNNASCAIGPFIRLFDNSYTLDNVRSAELRLHIAGIDGFQLDGVSMMREISRDPADLVAQTIGAHHAYPDGFMLFLGTMFAPTKDRGAKGEGFTHKIDDRVTISSPELGSLFNVMDLSTACAPWTFGCADLMRNLAQRDLL